MLEVYTPNFAALTDDQTDYLADAVHTRYPHFVPREAGPYESGEDLLNHCDAYQFDQADVVMALSRDASPKGVVIVEKLIGRPITRAEKRQKKQAAPRKRVNPVRGNDPRVITALAANPKRPGSASYDRFELYRVGMTVNEALAAGVRRADIKYDSERSFITLEAKA